MAKPADFPPYLLQAAPVDPDAPWETFSVFHQFAVRVRVRLRCPLPSAFRTLTLDYLRRALRLSYQLTEVGRSHRQSRSRRGFAICAHHGRWVRLAKNRWRAPYLACALAWNGGAPG